MDSWDILKLQNLAYVMTQNTSAQVELNAMMVANQERTNRGESVAYGYEQMMAIIDKYQLSHNAMLTNLHRGL